MKHQITDLITFDDETGYYYINEITFVSESEAMEYAEEIGL